MSTRQRPRLRILLGNEDALMTQIFKEAVSTEGGELIIAETTELAVRRVQDERFDGIFADTSLPNFSQSGFTRTVRKSKLNSRAPVILLAGLPSPKAGVRRAYQDVSVMAKYAVPAELPPLLRNLARQLMTDRRKHRRLSLRTSVNCMEGVRRFRATSINLSISGMLIETAFPMGVGSEMQLSFSLASGEPAMRAQARVARMEVGNRVGVSFQNMGNFERERIRQFLDLHLPPVR